MNSSNQKIFTDKIIPVLPLSSLYLLLSILKNSYNLLLISISLKTAQWYNHGTYIYNTQNKVRTHEGKKVILEKKKNQWWLPSI